MTTLSSLLESLNKPHLRYQDIAPLIDAIKNIEGVSTTQIGLSFEQRPINLISMGEGPIVIFAWTQMHGDEATATASVFDLIAVLKQAAPEPLQDWQKRFTLHILPMLNPDGAQRQTRQNAQSIDINRDALALQSPEGKLLMDYVKKLKPTIGFNLHDQSPYYQCGTSGNPATIAFLAPAFNINKDVDEPRSRAMRIIASMNKAIQPYIANCVARYNDDFSARSFGDNIAAMGVSTILIESGAAVNDPNRQIAREMNVKAMLNAMELMHPDNNWSAHNALTLDDYFAIPENISEALSSILIRNLHFIDGEHKYQADISIKQTKRYSNAFYIDFIGDAIHQSGLRHFDAQEYCYVQGKVLTVKEKMHIDESKYHALLKQGYCVFDDPSNLLTIDNGLDVYTSPSPLASDVALQLNMPAYFLLASLSSPKVIVKAVINGKCVSLNA